jgi:hypothetical protein
MFGRKAKAAEVSSSRFCMRAEELPYAHVYRYGRFTLALSKLSVSQSWPVRAHSSVEAVALGLLHGSNTYPDHGAEEPLLPVKLMFGGDHFKPERFGLAYFERAAINGPYLLHVHINDPTGDVLRAFQQAMQQAVSSGNKFIHLNCTQVREGSLSPSKDFLAQMDEDREFLRRVEAGEARLESIAFDRVFFEDALVTKAPSWSWEWESWEFDHPRFQSKSTAKWRREWLPYRLK